jgi:hypothetical protein
MFHEVINSAFHRLLGDCVAEKKIAVPNIITSFFEIIGSGS